MLENVSRKFELCQAQQQGRGSWIAAAYSYGSLVDEHLRVENQWIPEIAACALSPAQDERLCRKFDEIERSGIGATGREWYTQLIADYRDIVSTWGQWPST
jgi:hypothetical protein